MKKYTAAIIPLLITSNIHAFGSSVHNANNECILQQTRISEDTYRVRFEDKSCLDDYITAATQDKATKIQVDDINTQLESINTAIDNNRKEINKTGSYVFNSGVRFFQWTLDALARIPNMIEINYDKATCQPEKIGSNYVWPGHKIYIAPLTSKEQISTDYTLVDTRYPSYVVLTATNGIAIGIGQNDLKPSPQDKILIWKQGEGCNPWDNFNCANNRLNGRSLTFKNQNGESNEQEIYSANNNLHVKFQPRRYDPSFPFESDASNWRSNNPYGRITVYCTL